MTANDEFLRVFWTCFMVERYVLDAMPGGGDGMLTGRITVTARPSSTFTDLGSSHWRIASHCLGAWTKPSKMTYTTLLPRLLCAGC